jgi:hypothetical protein
MAHAKGANAALCMGFEDQFNVMPDPASGVILPFDPPFGLKVSQELKAAGTVTGRRDPALPFSDLVSCAGGLTVPLDAVCFGYWLKTMFGAPVTTQAAARNIALAAAADKGGGKVGIPVNAHGVPEGATVTIAGTGNYNGDHVALQGTSANEIVIAHAYVAESFTGGTTRAKLYTHFFKTADDQPSCFIEKQFLDIGQYELITGVKTNKMGFRVGGGGQLVCSMDLLGCNALPLVQATAVDTVTTMSLARFLFDGAYLYEGGALIAQGTEISADVGAQLDDGVYPIGNQGMRGSLPEGIMTLGGSLKCIFENAAFLEKGRTHAETSLKIQFRRAIETLSLEFEEAQFSRTSPAVETMKGLYADLAWQAYYDNGAAGAAVTATLVNQIPGY